MANWLLHVLARVTYLLQTLDVCGFSAYKDYFGCVSVGRNGPGRLKSSE